MRLVIDGFTKILHADIKLNGITVIAGENNSAKSTVGKILYCILNAFYDIARDIHNEKLGGISHEFRFLPFTGDLDTMAFRSIVHNNRVFFEDILSHASEKRTEAAEEYVSKAISSVVRNGIKPQAMNNIVQKIIKIARTDPYAIENTIVTRIFTREFNGQINNINNISSPAQAVLSSVDGDEVLLTFNSNRCISHTENFISRHEAIYIDSPFVVDALDDNQRFIGIWSTHTRHQETLIEKLRGNANNSIIDETINQEKLEKILRLLSTIVPGSFVSSDENDTSPFAFQENGFSSPLHLSNLSTGLKTFAIIKRLLENASITSNSVLILDEPEIHLHPKWQLAFAEILLLIQKEFNLTLLLNTHSPYFLNALEVYSHKYATSDKCNYYLAELDDNFAKFTDVTGNIEKIYEKLAQPFQTLENIKCNGMD